MTCERDIKSQARHITFSVPAHTLTKDSHNTGNFMLYSFRIVSGFFNVPLKHHANNLEGRCRKGSNRGDSTLLSSKEVTMATEPQSTSQAPVNTSLSETSVWSIDTYPKIWEGGRVKKQASEKATQAKAHGNVPANLPGTPQVSQATPLHWLGFNFA